MERTVTLVPLTRTGPADDVAEALRDEVLNGSHPPGTGIAVSAWTEGDNVVVEVADDGPGIPPGEEETIFRKFHRGARDEDLAPAGGSGLGLTICRGIVTAHGGRIWAEPRPKGGACFHFELPRIPG